MAMRVWYPQTRQEQLARAESLVKVLPLPKLARKKTTTMTPNGTDVKTKEVSKEVFDLKSFDNVRIGTKIDLPKRPASLAEVTQLFNNDEKTIIDMVYSGMIERATAEENLKDAIWCTYDAEDKLTDEIYEGPSADESKKTLIDAMVLNFAKAAFGFQNNRGKRDPKITEANNKAKEAARDMIRNNEAMKNSILNAK